MVSYKEMYQKKKEELKQLQNNSIDLRSLYKGKVLCFSKKFFKLANDQKGMIKLEKL